MKIVVSAAGTGGHIYPALSIINILKERDKNLEVLYIGTHNRMEKDIVPKHGIKYIGLEIYGLSKKNMLRNVKNVLLIKKAEKKCREIFEEFKPDLVIGAGGYVTYPVIKVAKKMRIKTFIHEQNSVPGKSNRMIAKNVDLVGVSFKSSASFFRNSKKVFYSGNPCFIDALKIEKVPKKELGLNDNKKLILIVSGSLGSSTVNEKFKIFLQLVDKEEYEIIYITGKNHYDKFIDGVKFPKNVFIYPYIDNLPGVMKNADLIITRAGASTISEILALKIPSILIPSPFVANNHQYYNALDLVNMNLAMLIEEKNLSVEKIKITIADMFKNETNYNKYKDNLSKLSNDISEENIYKEIMEVINSGK